MQEDEAIRKIILFYSILFNVRQARAMVASALTFPERDKGRQGVSPGFLQSIYMCA